MNTENTPVFELESTPTLKNILGLNFRALLLNIPYVLAMFIASGVGILFIIAVRYNRSRSIQRLIGGMDASSYIPNFLLATFIIFLLVLIATVAGPVFDIYLLKSKKDKVVINNDNIIYPTFGMNKQYSYSAFSNIHVVGNNILLPLTLRNSLVASSIVIYDLPEDKKQQVYDFLATKIKRKSVKFKL